MLQRIAFFALAGEPRMLRLRPRLTALATALVSTLSWYGTTTAAAAATATTCPALAPGAMVTFGDHVTAVPDRGASADCQASIDDLIEDERAWGSQSAFLQHVAQVTFDLLKAGRVTTTERARLLAAAPASGVGTTLKVKLIAFNDFHGSLEAAGSNPGVARLATKLAELKAVNPLHAVLSAGDLIGASPLVSALFHDEPTIEAMNRIGIDFNAVGNHEFDEGKAELLRMQQGGNHPTDVFSGKGLPADLTPQGQFAGARFGFLAANVTDADSGQTLLPGVGVKSFLGNKMAVIGMTLKSTPTIVSPSGVAGLSFQDEAETVNALIPSLRAQGIKALVVLVHEGGVTTGGGVNGCAGVSGPIVDIVKRLDPEVDLVITGHTHQAYNCLLPKRGGAPVRVTSAGQYGRLVTDIDVTLDPAPGTCVRSLPPMSQSPTARPLKRPRR